MTWTIRMAVAGAVAALLSPASWAQQEATGAGASFPAPLYSKWAADYNKATGVKINYQSVGSGAGIRQIEAKTVDFGASDAPLSDDDLKAKGLVQFPTVIGGVVPVINIKGLTPGQLKLTGTVLADIYLGKITHWNDAAIKSLNPGLTLPDSPIAVVRRADGSGTSFIFTNYLSKVSPEWKSKVGEGTAVNWPTGAGGPVHSRAFADLALPLGADLAQVVGEDEAGARAIGATHHGNRRIRQGQARVQRLDGGVIPVGDLAQVDVSQHSARQLQLAGGQTLDVDHGHHTTNHGGELHQALGLEVIVAQRGIGRTEIHGLGFDLADAGTRTHRLVVDLDAGGLVVISSPLRVEGSREAGASPCGFLLGPAGGGEQSGHSAGNGHTNRPGHISSPWWVRELSGL